MNEIVDRINAETPPFFKRVIKIGLTIGSVGLAIVSLPVTLPAVVLPALVIQIGGYMVAIGYAAASIAKTTKTDSPQ